MSFTYVLVFRATLGANDILNVAHTNCALIEAGRAYKNVFPARSSLLAHSPIARM